MKKALRFLLSGMVILISPQVFGQGNGNVGIGTNTPHSSSALDIDVTDKGILIPRVTTAQRVAIANPASGLLVYDTDFGQFWYYDGAQWKAAIGPQGPTGPQGLVGATGSAGAQGPQGLAGATGATGSQGPQGNVGAQGPTGPQGNVGAQGPTGPQGLNGATGVTGPQGPQGNVGAQGPQGPQGNVGAQGPQGPQGSAGATGPQGPQGNAGAQGPVGPQGLAGATGVTGPQGPQGNVGAQGPQGPQGNVGAQGPQGPQGSAGATGPQGPQGNAGAQGPQGPQGNVGSQGPQGLTGATGATGPVGCTSANYIIKSNGTSATCSQLFDNGTNVGLGTNSPQAKFHLTTANATGNGVPALSLMWVGGSNNQFDGQYINFRNPSSADANGMAWWSSDMIFGRFKNELRWAIKETHGGSLGSSIKDIIKADVRDAGGYSYIDRVTIGGDEVRVPDLAPGGVVMADGNGTLSVSSGAPTGQTVATNTSTSELVLNGNNTGTYGNSYFAGWTPGTWQDVTGFSVTKTIGAGGIVMINLTARIEGDNASAYSPSHAYFRVMRGGVEIGRSSVILHPANYVPSGFWLRFAGNLSMSFIDTGVSGSQTYTVQYWLANDYANNTEAVVIGERYLNVVELRP